MVYISHKDVKDIKASNSGDASMKLVYAFSNQIFKSGIIKQARKNRFMVKDESKRKRRQRALHKAKAQKKMIEDYKMGKDDMLLGSGFRKRK